MKRFIIVSLCLLAVTNYLFAQSVQPGVVKEYNEKKQKTPLSGVELIIKNAGSSVSDKKGLFTLKFRTLKPGDKVEYSRIEKNGYEIFNKDAVEAWRIANDGSVFTIVLCKSSKFKALKDRYNAVASKSYAEQQRIESAKLEGLLKDGKIQKVEYEKKLNALKNFYDEQLENLDNYIDRFARIDLSELSKEEQRIIDLMNDGKIGEAVSAYENIGLESQYIQARTNIKEAEHAIDQLNDVKSKNVQALDDTYSAIMRMNDMRRLQGGEENYRKIGETLKKIMEADTTNFVNVSNYANYISSQNNHQAAIRYFNLALNITDDLENRVILMQNLGGEYLRLGNLSQSERYLRKSEELLDTIQSRINERRRGELYGVLYTNLADVYSRSHKAELSKKYYEKALLTFPSQNLTIKEIDKYITTLANLGTLYVIELSAPKDALSVLHKADSLLNVTYGKDLKEENLRRSNVIKQTMASAFDILKQYDDADKYFTQSASIASELSDKNPQAYQIDELYLYNNWGCMLLKQKLYEKAENKFQKAYDLAQLLLKQSPSLYYKLLSFTVGGALANTQACQPSKWHEGKTLFDKILPEMTKMYENNKQMFTPYLSILYQQYAFTFMHHNDFHEALEAIDKAIELTPTDPNCYDSKGEILYNSGDVVSAKKMWDKVLELNPRYLDSCESELYKKLTSK